MNTPSPRTQVTVQKCLTWLFAALSVVMFLMLVHYLRELQRTKADIRLTRDVVWRIDAERAHALKGEVTQAVQYLKMFDEPLEPDTGFEKHLAAIITLQRKVAARDVMAFLRLKTGKDFGDEPQKWIEALEAEQARDGVR